MGRCEVCDGNAEFRGIRYGGKGVITLVDVVRVTLDLSFNNSPLARLRAVRARCIRNSYTGANQAECDQNSYYNLQVNVIQIATDHWSP